ncbi:MAG: toxin HicA [Gammaproteobacteria bacterium]|nr:toxin HicA [Gammaproteobacteria bacterium]
MANLDDLLKKMETSPQNIKYADLVKVCDAYFGEPRQNGTGHKVYKTPWAGDPRVNIQKGKGGKAKPYQVKQVLEAVGKIERSL